MSSSTREKSIDSTSNSQTLSRRDREKLVRRLEMIVAARSIFARKGFANTTLEDVALLAEFGKGTLYNYFPNKEALFCAVLEETFYGFKEIFLRVLSSGEIFEKTIEDLVRESLRYAFTNPEGIVLMSRESQALRENNPLMELHPQLVSLLADTIAAEQQVNREAMEADPAQLALILMNMVMGQFINRIHAELMSDEGNGEEQSTRFSCTYLTEELLDQLRDKNRVEKDVESATEIVTALFLRGFVGNANS